MKKTVQRHESDVNGNIMNQFSARKVEVRTEVTTTYTVFCDMTQFLYIHTFQRYIFPPLQVYYTYVLQLSGNLCATVKDRRVFVYGQL
jgi:hypothetical protein